jgi:hypothetical protein
MKQWAIGLMSNDEKRNILDQHKSIYDGYRTMQPQVSNTQPLYTQDFANDKGGVTVTNKGVVKPYMNFGINEQVVKKAMCSECGGSMTEGECSECGWKGGETKEGNAFTGALSDAKKNHKKEFEVDGKKFDVKEMTQQVKNLKKVEDLNLSDKFDYTEEEMYEDDALDADALQNLTGQKAPHMSDDMAPDGMDDDSDYDREMMADGEMDETNQGSPYDNRERAYTFKSRGPKDSGDAYSIKADDMDLDDEEVQEPFDFASNGAVREFDQMESAWDEDDDDLAILDYNQDDDDEYDDNDSWEEITSDKDSLDVDNDIKESVNKQKGLILEMMNRMKGRN